MANKKGFHTFVIRCASFPGTTEDILIPILEEESGKKVFTDFDVCVNPPLLRVGSLIEDFENAPFVLIGEQVKSAGDRLASLYTHFKREFVRVHIRTAEAAPFVFNSFQSVKSAFANEIGLLAKSMSMDSEEILRLLRRGTRLSVSDEYLWPGPAYGGPDLPSSVRRMIGVGKRLGRALPLLSAVPQSTECYVREIRDSVLAHNGTRIGLAGLAFRMGTDECRDSLLVDLASDLAAAGKDILIYDPSVRFSQLTDANRDHVLSRLPDLESRLAGSFDEIYNWSEIVVIGHHLPEIEYVVGLDSDKIIIDLVRVMEDISDASENYSGIGW